MHAVSVCMPRWGRLVAENEVREVGGEGGGCMGI